MGRPFLRRVEAGWPGMRLVGQLPAVALALIAVAGLAMGQTQPSNKLSPALARAEGPIPYLCLIAMSRQAPNPNPEIQIYLDAACPAQMQVRLAIDPSTPEWLARNLRWQGWSQGASQ